MTEHFLVGIDLDNLQNGLDLKTISFFRRVHIAVGLDHHQEACQFLEKNVDQFDIYFNCTALTNLEDVMFLLNSGATKVFVTHSQLEEIVSKGLLLGHDVGRLVVSLTFGEGEMDLKKKTEIVRSQIESLIPNVHVPIQLCDIQDVGKLDAVYRMSKQDKLPVRYVPLTHSTRGHFAEAIKDGHVPIIPATELTVDPKRYSELLPVHRLITDAIQSDRADGLFPTVVADERGICLGLVYSSGKSIETALQLGRGVYQSRRHGLWVKGEESGNTQELVSIAMDCDADALQFNVRQKGPGKCQIIVPGFYVALIVRRILSFRQLNLLWPLLWNLTP